jgi:hypothetical protein
MDFSNLQPYSLEHLTTIISSNQTAEPKIQQINSYLDSYLYPCAFPAGIFMYTHTGKFEYYKPQDVAAILKRGPRFQFSYRDNNDMKITWRLRDYYDNSTRLYYPAVKPGSPKVFEEDNVKFINQAYDMKIDVNNLPPPTMTPDLQFILDHLRDNLCSYNDAQYKYLLQWLSHSMTRKMKTSLFFKSGQGTGSRWFLSRARETAS